MTRPLLLLKLISVFYINNNSYYQSLSLIQVLFFSTVPDTLVAKELCMFNAWTCYLAYLASIFTLKLPQYQCGLWMTFLVMELTHSIFFLIR